MKRLRLIFVVLSTIGASMLLISVLYLTLNINKDTAQPADAIIILGAQSYVGNTINPCLKARVDHGVSLFNKKLAPILIVTGGNDRNAKTNEAHTMANIATTAGVPTMDIILEDKALTTYQNIIFSKKYLDEHNIKSIIVVTEPYHSPRAEVVAKNNLSQTVYISPAIESICWKDRWSSARSLGREVVALLYYFLTGKL